VRTLASATLVFEAIILGLAALVSVFGPSGNGHIDATTWLLMVTAILALVVPALLRFGWAYWLGWLVQIGAVVGGLVLNSGSLLVVGAIFALLYFFALRLGKKGDATRAMYLAQIAAGETSDTSEPGPAAPPVD
jgi:hypothetical protein